MMRILYLGSPDYAALPLRALVAAGHEIVGVVTQPDRPAGRSRVPVPPPVKVAALELGLPVLQPETLRDPAVVAQLAALRPEVAVLAAYGELIRRKVLAIPPLGFLNIHPSLLPRHRGPSPVVGAILAGDTETGVSVMRLDAGMDSGPILAQVRVPLQGDERAEPLTWQLFELGSQLLLEVLPPYAAGTLQPQPQSGEAATFTSLLKKDDGLIDWAQPAAQIERAMRAYDPWPGVFTFWRGQRLRVLTARVADTPGKPALPGSLLGGRPLVASGIGALELLEVQPAGRGPMPADAWLRGQKPVAGEALGVQ